MGANSKTHAQNDLEPLDDGVINEYHIISYQGSVVRQLLREPRFKQFSELDRISHGADVVGQSVPGGRTRM